MTWNRDSTYERALQSAVELTTPEKTQELMHNNFVELDSIADDLIGGTLDSMDRPQRVEHITVIVEQQNSILEMALSSVNLSARDMEVRHLNTPWSFNSEYLREAGKPWLIVGRSVEDMVDHAKKLRDLIETRRELWEQYQVALKASAE